MSLLFKSMCMLVVPAALAAGLSAQGRAAAPTTPIRVRRTPAYPVRHPDAALAAKGQQIFAANCSFCHGADARGGVGPNLVRDKLVMDDQHGELITQVVQSGIPPGMPKFSLSAADVTAIAAFLHSQPLGNRGAPSDYDVLVGNAAAGKAYFNGPGQCSTCHSVTGDLAGIGGKLDAKTLQNAVVSGREGRGRGSASEGKPTTVTVALASGQKVEGTLDHVDPFAVALTDSQGVYHSFARDARPAPRVEVHDPLQPHIDMLPTWTDDNIHNVTAYLTTLK